MILSPNRKAEFVPDFLASDHRKFRIRPRRLIRFGHLAVTQALRSDEPNVDFSVILQMHCLLQNRSSNRAITTREMPLLEVRSSKIAQVQSLRSSLVARTERPTRRQSFSGDYRKQRCHGCVLEWGRSRPAGLLRQVLDAMLGLAPREEIAIPLTAILVRPEQ
jgi:hypothetical protein